MTTKVNIPSKLSCTRCKHEWIPRKEVVKFCPGCTSPYWDRARVRTPRKKKDDVVEGEII